jgi:hypothetical protein
MIGANDVAQLKASFQAILARRGIDPLNPKVVDLSGATRVAYYALQVVELAERLQDDLETALEGWRLATLEPDRLRVEIASLTQQLGNLRRGLSHQKEHFAAWDQEFGDP